MEPANVQREQLNTGEDFVLEINPDYFYILTLNGEKVMFVNKKHLPMFVQSTSSSIIEEVATTAGINTGKDSINQGNNINDDNNNEMSLNQASLNEVIPNQTIMDGIQYTVEVVVHKASSDDVVLSLPAEREKDVAIDCSVIAEQQPVIFVEPYDPAVVALEAEPVQPAFNNFTYLVVPSPNESLPDPNLIPLPPLDQSGVLIPIENMTQMALRSLIPRLLKYSTGRHRSGWGRPDTRPPWWPQDVPWANIRIDCRSGEAKRQVTWTEALRKVAYLCYKYHGRLDLLPTGVDIELDCNNGRRGPLQIRFDYNYNNPRDILLTRCNNQNKCYNNGKVE